MSCPQCGFEHQCICSHIPDLSEVAIHLALLTHEREWERETNTGHLLARCLPQCRRYPWQRLQAAPELVAKMSSQAVTPFILYPSDESISVDKAQKIARRADREPLFIVLDGTWQEAQKIQRKTVWLSEVQHVHLNVDQASKYTLRRNQQPGHLCTLEVGAMLLNELGFAPQSEELIEFLDYYLRVYQAEKSGHALQPPSLNQLK